jgi:hypothetical protein
LDNKWLTTELGKLLGESGKCGLSNSRACAVAVRLTTELGKLETLKFGKFLFNHGDTGNTPMV